MQKGEKQTARLSVREAAKRLGLKPKAVRRAIYADRIAAMQPSGDGGRYYIDPAEVERFKRDAMRPTVDEQLSKALS